MHAPFCYSHQYVLYADQCRLDDGRSGGGRRVWSFVRELISYLYGETLPPPVYAPKYTLR